MRYHRVPVDLSRPFQVSTLLRQAEQALIEVGIVNGRALRRCSMG